MDTVAILMVLMAIMGVSLVDLVGSSSEHHTREGVQGTLAHGSCGCIYPCIVVVVVYISLLRRFKLVIS